MGRLSADMGHAMEPWDLHEISQLNEMKVDSSCLSLLGSWSSSGNSILVENRPIFGGYCGGIEETAICDVASTLATFVLLNGDIHLDGPIHIVSGSTTTKETLKISAHVARALDKNTNLMLGNQYYTMAGPCSEMCFTEIAAQAITDTVSGRELVSGVATCKGVVKDKTTGLEARMLSEVCSAAAGMDIEDANSILNVLIDSYDNAAIHPSLGKRFQECYNVKEVSPTEEYLTIYDEVTEKLYNLGLDI